MRLRLLPSATLACSLLTTCLTACLAACSSGIDSDATKTVKGFSGGSAGDPGSSGNTEGANGSDHGGAGAGSAAGPGSAAGGDAAAGGGNGGDSGAAGGSTGTGTSSGTGPGSGSSSYRVFASTDTTLYALDPAEPGLPLTKVGVFDCVDAVNGPFSSIVDIAVDKFQHLWGTTGHHVFPLIAAGGTVHCGPAIELTSPVPGQWVPTFYALTFAPVGVLDPLKEVLVAGNTAGELWSIDAAGNTEKHGFFGTVPADDGNGLEYDPAHVGKAWELSGDIVFLANEGKPVGFATVRDCPDPPSSSGCSKTDTLIEIDMAKFSMPSPGAVTKAVRGKILKKIDCNGALGAVAGGMFGIAAWNDSVFGFSRSGSFVRIDTESGAGCLLKNYFGEGFSGAGVTTLAPIVVPPLQ